MSITQQTRLNEKTTKPINYKTLGNLGRDFYETIDILLELNDWEDELSDLSYELLKELIIDVQYRFDLEENNDIVKIITKQIPIFEKKDNGNYCLSVRFTEIVFRYHSNEKLMKELMFKFIFEECLCNSFREYCNGLFTCSYIIRGKNNFSVESTNVAVSKGYVEIIERKLYKIKYYYRKLLIDLGLIVSVSNGRFTINSKLFFVFIDKTKIAIKIIKEVMDKEYKVFPIYFLKKVLIEFGFGDPNDIIDLLKCREMIIVRSTRSGNYVDFN